MAQETIPDADNWRLLEVTCSRYLSKEAVVKIHQAYRFARAYHKDQRRRSGEPYINHPVEVALILADKLHMDEDSICAALLHDTVEDTPATLEDISNRFGPSVAELVDGVTKLTNINADSRDEKQALNLRKMFLAMSKDIRVIIIKLADRLHNMRTLAALPPDRRLVKAHETMDVYAPLADRLGISSIKWELEDLAFYYLEPEEYQRVARMVQDSRAQREQNTDEAIKILNDELKRAGIQDFIITGRPKHLWSIYQKMQRKDLEFSDIYDLIALRVIVNTVGECYSVLGAVHSLWHPLPGRFKDYIATPKPNMYRSLHTTVIGPNARPIEIQIRTKKMHEQAEYGIAAHWLYKRSGNSNGQMSADDKSINSTINYIRKNLEWTTEGDIDDAHEFLNNLRVDLFEDEIFVFTPKSEVMSLRRDSTPLDFAYAIHTEVGNHCVGAKVNGNVVPLTYHLKMGDRVEILTNNNAKPSRDWVNIVVTPSARAKIRKYFSSVTKADDMESGRTELARELRKRDLGINSQRVAKAAEKILPTFDVHSTDDLLASIGSGKITAKIVVNRIKDELGDKTTEHAAQMAAHEERQEEMQRAIAEDKPLMRAKPTREQRKRRNNTGVVVEGGPNLMVHLAHCCNPVAGDKIVGFVTRGRGVSVHRANCPNVKNLMKHPERMIDVKWDTSGATEFQVEIVVEGGDRMGLLKDVTEAIGSSGANILSAATQTTTEGAARLRFLITISDASLLMPLLANVSRVPSVYDARRILPGEGSSQMKRRV
ncbi:MAG: bifunctional (p)ppGpp synthetase/guanosine-3',5'-bis(diphosphate) 3'-pyrophosphohydrolase [Coriobacteriaceae bacterium]|jgi:guanosine-3',5'-bis(diphosphate) 3'-pyrophosphohydrolase|uniref:RelA/SpoT family protein n=1 Tax=Atopobium sp. oral taxon 416 TaxID=712157 RepID=UPI000FF6AC4D|nr:bifunctional (p)ppGpp synthetase/guanosine-3',5'-bis(diphosphate) 3'-pyrophosphohydrolase [Atopobium sp. oral taxon 416]QUC02028.1 bifunctional (p)ppGpp synthetase/guanosine-3',5'-bis(diphosphate) 3'-pyrophosphohydrolase [Atopobium sp. oral taxon 416]RRF98970.1 MAG: bifunctional (p)ppGpp synthetase/guanosine-3',5'-bis(diphosphate) 3'-pyrophosphohydrolase [Coriobacteriaceae bacterium]